MPVHGGVPHGYDPAKALEAAQYAARAFLAYTQGVADGIDPRVEGPACREAVALARDTLRHCRDLLALHGATDKQLRNLRNQLMAGLTGRTTLPVAGIAADGGTGDSYASRAADAWGVSRRGRATDATGAGECGGA